jgi:hypothetical protein
MNLVYKKRNIISVLQRDLRILEIVDMLGPCSPSQVKEHFTDNPELLLVMRAMHDLVERGLLGRIVINNVRLYKTKANYKSIRAYLRADV